MVRLYRHTNFDGVTSRPKMHSGSSKTGQGVTANGSVSTLQRQQRPKTALNRQERSSCSSTASCPVFSARQSDQEEDPRPCCPPSLSSPTLQGSPSSQHRSIPSYNNSTVSSTSRLQGSLPSLQGSVRNLKSFPISSAFQSSNLSLRSSTTNFHSSSTSFKSSSSSLQSGSSSEDNSWGTNSWSSGATCLLRSSIKQHSEEVFRVRASSSNKSEPTSDSEAGYENLHTCQDNERQQKNQETAENMSVGCKDSVQSQTSSHGSTTASTTSADIEEKIEAKLKFSKFLDEVTCRVLDPDSLQAFGAVRQKEALNPSAPASLVNCSHLPLMSYQHPKLGNPWFDSNGNHPPTSRESKKTNIDALYQWSNCMPTCKILDTTESLKKTYKETPSMETAGRTYLETNIDSEWRKDDHLRKREREKRNLLIIPDPYQRTFKTKKSSCVVSNWSENTAKQTDLSTSLPRPVNSNLASNKEAHTMSYMQDQKENLQKHLSHTTHKLEMLESEFDTTRQNLEKELQQAQEELDKFIDKLHRIQSSYAALQRINQDLQDKIHRKTQLYEEEKRTLNQEIIKLNNHLMEANITIEKLRNDNDLYRKDCNLAAQLLQCGKSQHRVHKVSELPTDFQERVSSHIEKHGHSRRKNLCLSPSSDMVPTAIIAKVLEKPEAGNSCSVTCSPSPQSRDADFLTNNGVDTGDTLHRSVVYKSSDLYFSDTALYCPVVDRHQDHWNRRPQSVDLHCRDADLLQAQNSTDSNPEVDNLQPSFSNNDVPMYEFSAGSPAPSSSYSSISVASDEKGHAPNSTLSSPRALCVDWQAGVYEQKSTSNSHHKNSPGFPMLHSFQHMPPSPPKCNSPLYMRTASYSEPYQSPQLTSSHSIGYSGVPRETRIHIPEVGMTGGWRQLSMEDINTLPYYSAGHVSPYSFSKQHFTKGPSTIKQGPLYSSSLSQVRDNVFHTHNRVKNVKKEYTGISPNFSEKLQQNQQEVSNVQQYQLQSPLPQKKIPHHHQTFGSIGLSRKDSLNKAQLYGTLLN